MFRILALQLVCGVFRSSHNVKNRTFILIIHDCNYISNYTCQRKRS